LLERGLSNGTDLEAQFILALALHRLGRTSDGLARYTDALRKMGEWQDNSAAGGVSDTTAPTMATQNMAPSSWEYREERRLFRTEADAVFREEIAPDAPAP
jgi:hypothetical protein